MKHHLHLLKKRDNLWMLPYLECIRFSYLFEDTKFYLYFLIANIKDN